MPDAELKKSPILNDISDVLDRKIEDHLSDHLGDSSTFKILDHVKELRLVVRNLKHLNGLLRADFKHEPVLQNLGELSLFHVDDHASDLGSELGAHKVRNMRIERITDLLTIVGLRSDQGHCLAAYLRVALLHGLLNGALHEGNQSGVVLQHFLELGDRCLADGLAHNLDWSNRSHRILVSPEDFFNKRLSDVCEDLDAFLRFSLGD